MVARFGAPGLFELLLLFHAACKVKTSDLTFDGLSLKPGLVAVLSTAAAARSFEQSSRFVSMLEGLLSMILHKKGWSFSDLRISFSVSASL